MNSAPECDYCGSEEGLTYQCNECDGKFCPDHRLPENHYCMGLRAGESSTKPLESGGRNTDEGSGSPSASESTSGRGNHVDTSIHEEPGRPLTDEEIQEQTPDSPTTSPSSSEDLSGAVYNGRSNVSTTGTSSTPSASRSWIAYFGSYLLLPFWIIREHKVAVSSLVLVTLLLATVGPFAAPMDLPTTVDERANDKIDDLTGEGVDQLVTGVTSAFNSSDQLNQTKIRYQIHERVNEIRAKRGLSRLRYSSQVAQRAEEHSVWMANRTQLEHANLRTYPCSDAIGENVAYTYATGDIETEWGVVNYYGNETRIANGIVKQWMHSRGHRKNILSSKWSVEGIGIAVAETDQGPRVYATQAFCG